MLAKLRKIAKSLWLLVATSGLVSIVVGLVAMIRPQLVLSVFIYLFGVLVLLISAIILGKSLLSVKKDNLWWTSMIFAVCGISIGTMVLANPIVAQAFIAAILAIYIFIQSTSVLSLMSMALRGWYTLARSAGSEWRRYRTSSRWATRSKPR